MKRLTDVFEVRSIAVNALVHGCYVTLFNNQGQRLITTQLSRIEGASPIADPDSWVWLATLDLKLWRDSQQRWKAENRQDPWKKKATQMASGLNSRARRGNPPLRRRPRTKDTTTSTWDEAAKYMAHVARAHAIQKILSPWERWAYRKSAQFRVSGTRRCRNVEA